MGTIGKLGARYKLVAQMGVMSLSKPPGLQVCCMSLAGAFYEPEHAACSQAGRCPWGGRMGKYLSLDEN